MATGVPACQPRRSLRDSQTRRGVTAKKGRKGKKRPSTSVVKLRTQRLAGCWKTRHWMAGRHESSATMRVIPQEEARMRGEDEQQASVWSYIPLEQRVPVDHPLRALR